MPPQPVILPTLTGEYGVTFHIGARYLYVLVDFIVGETHCGHMVVQNVRVEQSRAGWRTMRT